MLITTSESVADSISPNLSPKKLFDYITSRDKFSIGDKIRNVEFASNQKVA